MPSKKIHKDLNEYLYLRTLFDKESDRGIVLISCSFIDNQLNKILLSFLKDCKQSKELVEGYNAPLGTYSNRIEAAYCMGLINEDERKDCRLLGKVRNEFAHGVHTSFNDKQIISLCHSLTYFEQFDFDGPSTEPKDKFIETAMGLLASFVFRPAFTSKEQLVSREWKPDDATILDALT